MLDKIDQARKAVAALILPALGTLVLALLESSDGGQGVTAAEWLGIVAVALGTSGAVYGVRNGTSLDPTTSTPEPDPYRPGR